MIQWTKKEVADMWVETETIRQNAERLNWSYMKTRKYAVVNGLKYTLKYYKDDNGKPSLPRTVVRELADALRGLKLTRFSTCKDLARISA